MSARPAAFWERRAHNLWRLGSARALVTHMEIVRERDFTGEEGPGIPRRAATTWRHLGIPRRATALSLFPSLSHTHAL